MELIYANEKVREQCTNVKAASKLFGGDKALVMALINRISRLEEVQCLKDIVVNPIFHFHKLKNKDGRDLEGYFAIDVKSRKDAWRLIIQPLDDNKKPFDSPNIDQIVGKVRIIGIREVSKHYE